PPLQRLARRGLPAHGPAGRRGGALRADGRLRRPDRPAARAVRPHDRTRVGQPPPGVQPHRRHRLCPAAGQPMTNVDDRKATADRAVAAALAASAAASAAVPETDLAPVTGGKAAETGALTGAGAT